MDEFVAGNTRIKICDDYCRGKTPGEVQEILDRVARDALGALQTVAAPPDP